jgi:hypothetical protein
MKLLHVFVLSSALAGISGCPTRDKYDRMPTVRITSPAPDSYRNGFVHITAAIDPILDLPIVLRVDGTLLMTLASPAASFDWNTAGVPEGPHTLIAEVEFSNRPATSAPVTVTVDRNKPTVTLTPAPGAEFVTLRSAIQAVFSEPIVLSQSASETFALSIRDTIVPTTVTIDDQNQAATIVIDDLTSLSLPAPLSVTMAGTITDRAGNVLAAPESAWLWNVPDWIKIRPIQNVTTAVIAIRSDLRPTAAWISGGRVHVATYDPLTDWVELAPIANNISATQGVAVALVAQDRPFVVWSEKVALTGDQIRAATWNGTAWNAVPSIVPPKGPGNYARPILRVAGGGRPTLAWMDLPTGTLSVARWDGSSWDKSIQTISTGTNSVFDMAITGSNNPIISWADSAGVWQVSTWTGTAWTYAPTPQRVFEPYFALDSLDAPMIVSGQFGWLIDHLMGDAWEHLTTMAITSTYSRHARLAADPNHLPVVAWVDNPINYQLQVSRWTGTAWDTRAGQLSWPANVVDEAPQVVVDRQGSVWLGWREAGTSAFNIWMSNV